jgi:hypothetical protein
MVSSVCRCCRKNVNHNARGLRIKVIEHPKKAAEDMMPNGARVEPSQALKRYYPKPKRLPAGRVQSRRGTRRSFRGYGTTSQPLILLA